MNESGRQLYIEMQTLSDQLAERQIDMQLHNVAKKLNGIRDTLLSLVKSVYRHKRTPATHALVIMISPEERCKKPYALPVQCIPYSGLADNNARQLMNLVIKEMVERGIKVAGKL